MKGSALHWPPNIFAPVKKTGNLAPFGKRIQTYANCRRVRTALWAREPYDIRALARPGPLWIAVLDWLIHPLVFESSRDDFKCYD